MQLESQAVQESNTQLIECPLGTITFEAQGSEFVC